MTVQASPSRPPTKSVGAAVLGILLTLAIFATVMLSFLIAPLVVLLGAYFIYAMFRGRKKKSDAPPAGAAQPGQPGTHPGTQSAPPRSSHGFGAGTS